MNKADATPAERYLFDIWDAYCSFTRRDEADPHIPSLFATCKEAWWHAEIFVAEQAVAAERNDGFWPDMYEELVNQWLGDYVPTKRFAHSRPGVPGDRALVELAGRRKEELILCRVLMEVPVSEKSNKYLWSGRYWDRWVAFTGGTRGNKLDIT